MDFKFGEFNDKEQILFLYRSVGWTEYTKDSARLFRALKNSLDILTIWNNNELIGLIRAVGDGETILYIQDLLIRPDYQNQGLGSILLQKMGDRYQNVRQKVLITDNTNKTNSFYEKNGFVKSDYLNLNCYYFKQK
ncbi:GNAT family N-acetyltransferase [Ligilactobacillus aviarius]|uniref:GNAT family N-acetyltransferase n=1 Tax=Ligilactobacillus aviarius TaxID=1606 RepID=UPI0024B926E4|nr:GNAT family N-acetyltransferase [Ligilactobacillus aviarius]